MERTELRHGDAERSAENAAVWAGRGDVALAGFVSIVVTGAGGFLWLQFMQPGESSFDFETRLETFGTHLGTASEAIAVVAAFSAVAIALAVTLSGALSQLGALDRPQPCDLAVDSAEPTAPIRSRSRLMAIIIAELMLTVAMTSWAILAAVSLWARALPAPAMVATFLAAFLLIESVRCFVVIRTRPPTLITPLASDLEHRLSTLSDRRVGRGVYAIAWWGTWALSSVGAALALAAITTPGDTFTAMIGVQLTFFFCAWAARVVTGDGLLESRASRTLSVVAGLIYTAPVMLVVYTSIVVSHIGPDTPDFSVILTLPPLIGLLVLLVIRVFDVAGMPQRLSSAGWHLARSLKVPAQAEVRSGTSAQWSTAASLAALVSVSAASVGVAGLFHRQGLALALLTLALVLGVAVSNWRFPRLSTVVSGGIVVLIAALAPGGGAFTGLWAGYTLIAIAAASGRGRIGNLINGAADRWQRSHLQRRRAAWEKRVDQLKIRVPAAFVFPGSTTTEQDQLGTI